MNRRRSSLLPLPSSLLPLLTLLVSVAAWSAPAGAASKPARPAAPAPSSPANATKSRAERSPTAAKSSSKKQPMARSADTAARTSKASELDAQRAAKAARMRQMGAMSVGLPNTGVLVNGVRMPHSDDWVITMPSHGFATEETVAQLSQCISAARAEFPDSPRVMLGSLSAEQGGHLPPHKSHRTGRDADVYFFRKPEAPWNKAATEEDIDLPRTWALLRCFVSKADVDMVLIDRKVQGWIERYALSIGEPPEWIEALFHDRPGTKSALVRHVPGHVAHMHVRFVSPRARKLAVQHYQELVGAGLVRERIEEGRHQVIKGDTLLGLAKRYATTVEEIRSLNRLKGTVIRLGQVLVVKQGKPIEGIAAPIYGPGRSLPPEPCEPGPKACHAGLALVNRPPFEVAVGEAPEHGAAVSLR